MFDHSIPHIVQILFEILPKGVNKGSVLPKLTAHLGLDMKNTVAIGDYYNDIPMIRAARYGVAVANACDAAKAAAYAKQGIYTVRDMLYNFLC